MIARGEGGAWPYIELAKYYEHVQHGITTGRSVVQPQRCNMRSTLRRSAGKTSSLPPPSLSASTG